MWIITSARSHPIPLDLGSSAFRCLTTKCQHNVSNETELIILVLKNGGGIRTRFSGDAQGCLLAEVERVIDGVVGVGEGHVSGTREGLEHC